MTYTHINEMFGSGSLRDRITAAIAQEVPGIDPVAATNQYMWLIITRADWIAAWGYAGKECSECGSPLDTGRLEDVITDNMILAAVQAIRDSGQQPA